MALITKADFTGMFDLARATASDPVLQDYIDRLENKYIRQLLGVELGNAFIAGIAVEPTPDAKWTAIHDAFQDQDDDCDNKIYESSGIKEYLKAGIFHDYIVQQQAQHSQSGVIEAQAEVSTVMSGLGAARFAEQRWNTVGMDTAEAIQWYVKENQDDYDETFNGITIEPRYAALL